MDRSAEGGGPVAVAEIPQRPDRTSVRRKLVQSTLFPHKSPIVVQSNADQKGDEDDDCVIVDEDGKDEEYCGSQGKKKRGRKRKSTTPTTKAPKESNDATPKKNSTPKKKNATPNKNSTPRKNSKSDGKTVPQLQQNGDPSPMPNLRLEAKLTAEENSRIFAGKQVHPFFSSWKASKKSNDATEGDGNSCLLQRKNKRISLGPIHVFEQDQDDTGALDWRNWKFLEESISTNHCDLEAPGLSSFEGSIESLCFNRLPSHHAQDSCSQFVKDTEVAGEVGLHSSCERKSDPDPQSEYLQERISSSYFCCTSQLEDRLWIDKYQPKKAMEVCGNDESVRFLNEWLRGWYERSHQANKDSCDGDERAMEDSDADYNSFGSDCDSENRNENAGFKNVLLITGPVGSGKSAAIYACANEQGFKVLEVNASECRNGAIVKQKFGAALESHCLEWSKENNVETPGCDTVEVPNDKAMLKFDNEVVEVVPISDEDGSYGATETYGKFACKDSSIACGRGSIKSLILFEDVDIIFPEDRGFVAAIQQIAKKAKGPVILTSNSYNPQLPDNFDRIEVCFEMPSEEELLQNVNAVCSAEKASIERHLIDQLIKYCQGDIRKTIMHLQFWCQGKQFTKGGEVQSLSGPLLFDTELAHKILPKMITWGLPSRLSELVEKEITTALAKMDENYSVMDIIEDEFDDREMLNNLEMHASCKENLGAKKEAMLKQDYSDHNCNESPVPVDIAFNLLDTFDAPVSVSCQRGRRKLNVVMSSDSEDEILDDRLPVTSGKQTNDEAFLEVNSAFLSTSQDRQNCSSLLNNMQFYSEAGNLKGNYFQCSEAAINFDLNESLDFSHVPESSFVPETEVVLSGMSCAQVADIIGEDSVSNGSKENLLSVNADNSYEPIVKLHNSDLVGRPSNDIAVSFDEEVEDSSNEHVEAVTRGYQLMDECSRMHFNGKSTPVEDLRTCLVKNLVQDSWRKLREQHTDLKQSIALENKNASGIIKLSHGISNLISEAEILYSQCQPLGSLELPMAHLEALDPLSWYDEHLQMTSTMAQHGFSSYAKDINDAALKMGFESRSDMIKEMMSRRTTTHMKEVHSLIGEDMGGSNSLHTDFGAQVPESGIVSKSDLKTRLGNIMQSIVPSRTYMTLKGDAFYEYASSLGCISRSEASRGLGKRKGRRGRAAQNYLSTGSLALSPEEISLLGESNIYGKTSSKPSDSLPLS